MTCDTRCSMHSHEGHKCDCGCECHKLNDAKPMTAEDRAKDIVEKWVLLLMGIPKSEAIKSIAEQIQQACAEAHAEGVKDGSFKCDHEKDKDYAKGFSEGRQEAVAEFKETNNRLNAYAEKKVNEAWNDAIEKAAKVAQTHDKCEPHYDEGSSAEHLCMRCGMTIADRIRAMERDKGAAAQDSHSRGEGPIRGMFRNALERDK